MEYYREPVQRVLQELHTGEKGLSTADAKKRLIRYGPNELATQKGINPFLLFLSQFKNFIIYILIFAVIIAILAHEYIDAIIILIILVFNAFFGFIQEYRAEKSIEALKRLAGFKAKVIRNNQTILIDARELVPGDILVLEAGSKISADARIISENNLEIEEASLTGESSTVGKHNNPITAEIPINDQKNMVFSSTNVAKGHGLAVVVGTGMNTEIGRIAKMITAVKDEDTPLQKKLDKLGKWIGLGTIFASVIIFVEGVTKEGLWPLLFSGDIVGFIFATKTWLLTAVSLAVAAVPEGLPAIVTISLAIGVKKMLQKNALIRNLPSVETLGETTVICSDKTGTLTKNEMTVEVAYMYGKEFTVTGKGYSLVGEVLNQGKKLTQNEQLLFTIGAACNDAQLAEDGIVGDPTEGCLLVSAEKAGVDTKQLAANSVRLDEESFDSERKMMSTVTQVEKEKFVYTKGAPENVLDVCTHILVNGVRKKLTNNIKKEILEKNKEYAQSALRVLGFAYKKYTAGKIEDDLTFVGLQGMMDPPHEEVKEAIARCHRAGIHVIMVTGDNKYTAKGIAEKIGITGETMNGLEFEKLNRAQQLAALKDVAIFARVEPKHKIQIVTLLQERGEIVTMTGDGVNDAPAVKKADLGVSMGITGTDVTKEASKMVILDDNFTSIVNAVESGRWIYTNIKKFVNYLLSSNIGEVLVILFAILFDWHLPMTAIMLLWLNLVTDGLPALALSVDPKPKGIMDQPPVKAKEGIMNKSLTFHVMYVAILIAIGTLGLFYWAMGHYAGTEHFIEKTQTIAFTAIIVMEIVRLQAIRSEYKLSMFSNKYLVYAVLASFALQLMVIYTPLNAYFKTVPLSGLDWLMILLTSAGMFILNWAGSKIAEKTFLRE